MHIHIDGKENEKILSYVKIKTCWHLKLKEALQDFPTTLEQGTTRQFDPDWSHTCWLTLLHNYFFLSKWVSARHNITQLLICILWDHVSSEYNPPLMVGFPIIYGEHSGCVLWSFQQATVYYQSFSIASYFFGKGASFSCLMMLWLLELKDNPIGYNSPIMFHLDESNHSLVE